MLGSTCCVNIAALHLSTDECLLAHQVASGLLRGDSNGVNVAERARRAMAKLSWMQRWFEQAGFGGGR